MWQLVADPITEGFFVSVALWFLQNTPVCFSTKERWRRRFWYTRHPGWQFSTLPPPCGSCSFLALASHPTVTPFLSFGMQSKTWGHHQTHLGQIIRKTNTWPPPLSPGLSSLSGSRWSFMWMKTPSRSAWSFSSSKTKDLVSGWKQRDLLTSWLHRSQTECCRSFPSFSRLPRFEDSRLQLLPEAAHLSALHDPSGDGRSRSGRCDQSQRRTADLRQQQMVGGKVTWTHGTERTWGRT